MKEQLDQHVKNVKELSSLCEGNEATTKTSLMTPLFTILGWNMANPRECISEYRADFGKGVKAATPMDWMFSLSNTFSFIVEAKSAEKKLKNYAEQLGMYFAKTAVGLGILSNGIQWQFYTDLDRPNIMDHEPFLTWDIENDPIPMDFLTILQKQEFKPQLVKTFAERGRKQSLLVGELSRILAPSPEFVKMAIQNIESQKMTDKVIEQWKPILANSIQAWVRLKTLDMALERPNTGEITSVSPVSTRVYKGKTCPQCNTSGLGGRTKTCKCGYVFTFATSAEDEETTTLKMNTTPVEEKICQ